jgi:hypothetical protein
MAKSKQQLADEAYERSEARRAKSLQLDIESALPPAEEPTTVVERAPIVCPACNQDMQDGFGGSWTPMTRGMFLPFKLQCGHCGHMEFVVEEVWKAVRDERYQKVGVSDVKPQKPESSSRKRTRGAG